MFSKKGMFTCVSFCYIVQVMQHATKGFSESQRLGGGAFGTVYAGKLSEGTRVAVKKVNQANAHCLHQFRNEVELLCKVRHSGLVRLLGCCLDLKDPLVVYEYVSNGTLRQHLQQERGRILSWGSRMKIAVETAKALAYLHSVLSPPIFHRDVKSSNILLDRSYAAKLADFGLSRLVPLGVTHVSTIAQGTPGYVDPDYYRTYQLTDKSDVYSFGVVLMELVTARKAIDHNHEGREVPLASLAITKLTKGELELIIDPALQRTMTPECRRMIQQIAELAFRCLAFTRQDRPCMNEVSCVPSLVAAVLEPYRHACLLRKKARALPFNFLAAWTPHVGISQVADVLEDIRVSTCLNSGGIPESVLHPSLGHLFSALSSSD